MLYWPTEGSVLQEVSLSRCLVKRLLVDNCGNWLLTKIRLVGATLQAYSFLCALNQEVANQFIG